MGTFPQLVLLCRNVLHRKDAYGEKIPLLMWKIIRIWMHFIFRSGGFRNDLSRSYSWCDSSASPLHALHPLHGACCNALVHLVCCSQSFLTKIPVENEEPFAELQSHVAKTPIKALTVAALIPLRSQPGWPCAGQHHGHGNQRLLRQLSV